MLFILNGFVHDWKTYGFSVAWYNVRFLLGTGIAKSLVGRPMFFHVHDSDCPQDEF